MSRSRREVQHQLPFTAAFALIQALRAPSGLLAPRKEDPHSKQDLSKPSDFMLPEADSMYPKSFRPDFMNTLSEESSIENERKPCRFESGK